MLHDVTQVVALEGHRLRLVFDDGIPAVPCVLPVTRPALPASFPP